METEIPVRDIMTRPVITADADLDILSAAKKMGSANVGSLIIVCGDKPTGILTERDLVKKVIAQGIDPRNLKVGEIMSSPVNAIEPDASLRDAAALMLRSRSQTAARDIQRKARGYNYRYRSGLRILPRFE